MLKQIFGLTFHGNEAETIYALTLILVGSTTAWLVAHFYMALNIYDKIKPNLRILTTVALALGTILTSFSVTLNNYTISAALLFASCHAAWSGHYLRAGVLISLVTCVDIVTGVVFMPALALIIYDASYRKGLSKYLLVLCIGVAVFALANWLIVGSPLPPKMAPGAIDHSSQFALSNGNVQINVPVHLLPDPWYYPLLCLFGWHGFFLVSPVLFFGALGMVVATRTGNPLSHRCCFLLGSACVVLTTGHVLFVGSFGGWSYGYRYLIPIIPILLFFVPVVLKKGHIRFFKTVLAVSIVFALIGVYNPWPPVYEPETKKQLITGMVTNPIGGNLSAWIQEYLPGFWMSDKIGSVFISQNIRMRNQYLTIFYMSKGDITMRDRLLNH